MLKSNLIYQDTLLPSDEEDFIPTLKKRKASFCFNFIRVAVKCLFHCLPYRRNAQSRELFQLRTKTIRRRPKSRRYLFLLPTRVCNSSLKLLILLLYRRTGEVELLQVIKPMPLEELEGQGRLRSW